MASRVVAGGAWPELARCRGADTRLFFPDAPELVRLAMAYCTRCPVRESCLAAALADPELLGIWGGTTEQQRRSLRRRRRAALRTASR